MKITPVSFTQDAHVAANLIVDAIFCGKAVAVVGDRISAIDGGSIRDLSKKQKDELIGAFLFFRAKERHEFTPEYEESSPVNEELLKLYIKNIKDNSAPPQENASDEEISLHNNALANQEVFKALRKALDVDPGANDAHTSEILDTALCAMSNLFDPKPLYSDNKEQAQDQLVDDLNVVVYCGTRSDEGQFVNVCQTRNQLARLKTAMERLVNHQLHLEQGILRIPHFPDERGATGARYEQILKERQDKIAKIIKSARITTAVQHLMFNQARTAAASEQVDGHQEDQVQAEDSPFWHQQEAVSEHGDDSASESGSHTVGRPRSANSARVCSLTSCG